VNRKLYDFADTAGVSTEIWFSDADPNTVITAPDGSLVIGPAGLFVNNGGGTTWDIAGGIPALLDVLLSGNETSGTDLVISSGDALRLKETAPSATGAGEGAIFFSDGTSGLTAGRLYTRPASNGTPTPIESGAIDFYSNVWVAWKKPVRVATTANVASLAGGAPLSVDGVTVVANDRVLVWNQTAGAENGIYTVTTPGSGADGTWARATDFDASGDITSGLMVYVQEGTANGRTRLTLTTANPITLAATALTFLQEAPLVRTDSSSTEIRAAGAFTNGTILWSSAVDMRDHKEISVWFIPTNIGTNTSVDLLVQWSDDGSTIAFDDDNGVQQTDFLLASSADGSYKPKDYVTRITTGTSELAANKIILLTFPKKGGSFRYGVKGNHASGSFSVRSQRLA
jgi:hypothetical protein